MMRNMLSIFRRKILPSSDLVGCKMAIVVRTDVSMGKGKAAAQCAHAAVECYRQAATSKNQNDQALLRAWTCSGQPKIVLKISSYNELAKLAKTAKKEGVITATIADAGRTQLAPGTVAVLGIGPASKNHIELLTSHLKLL